MEEVQQLPLFVNKPSKKPGLAVYHPIIFLQSYKKTSTTLKVISLYASTLYRIAVSQGHTFSISTSLYKTEKTLASSCLCSFQKRLLSL